jgi:hypothetical protein
VLHLGFARYLQFIGANSSLTQSGVMDRYTIDVIQLAMAFDAGPNTEPVRSNVTDEITNQNSRIIYDDARLPYRRDFNCCTQELFGQTVSKLWEKYNLIVK